MLALLIGIKDGGVGQSGVVLFERRHDEIWDSVLGLAESRTCTLLRYHDDPRLDLFRARCSGRGDIEVLR